MTKVLKGVKGEKVSEHVCRINCEDMLVQSMSVALNEMLRKPGRYMRNGNLIPSSDGWYNFEIILHF